MQKRAPWEVPPGCGLAIGIGTRGTCYPYMYGDSSLISLPVDSLDVLEDIGHLVETPGRHRIRAIQLSLTVHDVGFPIGHHCEGETVYDNEPEGVEDVLECLAEAIALC